MTTKSTKKPVAKKANIKSDIITVVLATKADFTDEQLRLLAKASKCYHYVSLRGFVCYQLQERINPDTGVMEWIPLDEFRQDNWIANRVFTEYQTLPLDALDRVTQDRANLLYATSLSKIGDSIPASKVWGFIYRLLDSQGGSGDLTVKSLMSALEIADVFTNDELVQVSNESAGKLAHVLMATYFSDK